jgi:hypothetical protein
MNRLVFPTPVGVFLAHDHASGRSRGRWGCFGTIEVVCLPHARGGVSAGFAAFANSSSPRPYSAATVRPTCRLPHARGVCYLLACGRSPTSHCKLCRYNLARSSPRPWRAAMALPHARGGVSVDRSNRNTTVFPTPRRCFQASFDGQSVFPTPVGVFPSRPPTSSASCLPPTPVWPMLPVFPTPVPCGGDLPHARILSARFLQVFPTPVGVFL